MASLAGRLQEAERWLVEPRAHYRVMAERRFEDVIASELAHALRRDGRLDEAEYRLTICIGNRIRDILNAGASVVRDNGDRLISCLVLATEERA